MERRISHFQNSVSFENGFRKTVQRDSFSVKSKVDFPKTEVLENPHMTFFSTIMGVLLLIGIHGAAIAQTGAAPILTGYFVSINSQQSGPFDTAGLRQLISNGQLTRTSLVWKEGMPNWTAAGTVEELAPLFSASPPPLPPPIPSETSQQPVSQAVQGGPWGGHPVVAGFANTVFGIWSFTNSDISGGLLTAALEAGGITLSIIGSSLYRSWYYDGGSTTVALIIYYAGYAALAGGSIYGFYRGYTQYNTKTATARSFAEAISDNPMNNISLVVFPTFDKGRVAGAVTYSLVY